MQSKVNACKLNAMCVSGEDLLSTAYILNKTQKHDTVDHFIVDYIVHIFIHDVKSY